MIRPAKFITESYRQRDWFAIFLLGLMLTIVAWIVSILFSSTTRQHAMQRFQLASPNFLGWAAMAPVPAMYNFENQIQFGNELIGGEAPFDEEDESWFSKSVNHFPARAITFGDFVTQFFGERRQGTFEMSTRFRETELISRWEIREQSDGSMRIHRISENWVRHDANE